MDALQAFLILIAGIVFLAVVSYALFGRSASLEDEYTSADDPAWDDSIATYNRRHL